MKMEKNEKLFKSATGQFLVAECCYTFFSLHLYLVLLGMSLPTKLRVTASISTFTVS